jgi:serine protease AprX
MATASPDTEYEVIVVYNDPAVLSLLTPLTSVFYKLQVLPATGLIFTSSEIELASTFPGVSSISLNRELDYFLHESVSLIGADQVWSSYGQRGGNNTVRVAVIDSGIDGVHADLQFGDKVVQNVFITPFAVGVEDLPLTDVAFGHGTHVSSIIGGSGAASDGYYQGVAPEVELVGLGSGAGISILSALQSYDWVLEHQAEYDIRIVNSSWGTSGGELNINDPIVMATYEAYKRGILSVFAAGNDGGNDSLNPYSLAPWVLSVAAGDKNGNLAGFSSRGLDGSYLKHPDLTAPGVDIYAARAIIPGVPLVNLDPNPVNPAWTVPYTKMSGTSMAAPHVSGAAALLLSENPQLSPDQLIELLTTTTTPMPGEALHEAGSGYLDALAAYEASLNVNGNLSAFLNGDRDHSLEEALDFDPNELSYDTAEYSGFTLLGLLGLPAVEYPVAVNGDVAYIQAELSWTPALEDAFDLQIVNPQGNIVATSSNLTNLTESALAVPAGTGQYKVRVVPFLAVGANYTLTITTAYAPGGSPPGEQAFDYTLEATSVNKNLLVLGLAAVYFRGGDSGAVVFSVTPADGGTGAGLSQSLRVVYADRNGDTWVDETITDQGNGLYESGFALDNSWPLAPGPIDVYLAYTGGGTFQQAAPVRFYLNHLNVTLQSNSNNYNPGSTIQFNGTVKKLNTIALLNVQSTPANAAVTVKLINNEGTVLATKSVQANLLGKFSGSLVAPAGTNGPVRLVAEATFYDVLILTGPKNWYGQGEKLLSFPGNLAPQPALAANAAADENGNQFAHVHATVVDPDGNSDIETITVVIADAAGNSVQGWQEDDFVTADEGWTLTGSHLLAGNAPWTVTLTAVDSAGHTAVHSQMVED